MLPTRNRRGRNIKQTSVMTRKKPSGGIPRAFLEVSHRRPSTRSRAAKSSAMRRNLINCFLQAIRIRPFPPRSVLHHRHCAIFETPPQYPIKRLIQSKKGGGSHMIEKKLDRAITDFIWNVVEIHSQLEDIHTSWAELLGITEPQWLILMAITELDEGRGV